LAPTPRYGLPSLINWPSRTDSPGACHDAFGGEDAWQAQLPQPAKLRFVRSHAREVCYKHPSGETAKVLDVCKILSRSGSVLICAMLGHQDTTMRSRAPGTEADALLVTPDVAAAAVRFECCAVCTRSVEARWEVTCRSPGN